MSSKFYKIKGLRTLRIRENLEIAANDPESAVNWRQTLRKLIGAQGQGAWEIIAHIARGTPWVPILPDGREGPVQIPSPDVRFRAAKHLTEMLFGTPAAQTEIAKAEVAASEQESIRALPQEELERRVKMLIEAKRDIERSPKRDTDTEPDSDTVEAEYSDATGTGPGSKTGSTGRGGGV